MTCRRAGSSGASGRTTRSSTTSATTCSLGYDYDTNNRHFYQGTKLQYRGSTTPQPYSQAFAGQSYHWVLENTANYFKSVGVARLRRAGGLHRREAVRRDQVRDRPQLPGRPGHDDQRRRGHRRRPGAGGVVAGLDARPGQLQPARPVHGHADLPVRPLLTISGGATRRATSPPSPWDGRSPRSRSCKGSSSSASSSPA